MSAQHPTFFETPELFRRWLAEHHASAAELWVGFWKRGSGIPCMTWPQSVDEALCYGWIDALRKTLDEKSYVIRFCPRRVSSSWSAVNLRRIEELLAEGRVTPAGLDVYEKRGTGRRIGYTYGAATFALTAEYEETFWKEAEAWQFFSAQAPSYQRLAFRWVMSAVRPETRQKRLEVLIERSRQGLRMPYS